MDLSGIQNFEDWKFHEFCGFEVHTNILLLKTAIQDFYPKLTFLGEIS